MAKKVRTRKYWRTALALQGFLGRIPYVLSGQRRARSTADKRTYDAFWSAVILSLFTDIHEGYRVKAEGGTDELGTQWEDLAPTTKAYKRRGQRRGKLTASERRNLKNPDTIGLLNPSQYSQWKKTFARVYRNISKKARKDRHEGYLFNKVDKEAKAIAAGVAWKEAKAKGAKTLLQILGSQKFPIMRVTHTLFRSTRPGKIVNLKYRKGDKNQLVNLVAGKLEIGSRVPYANYATRMITRKDGLSFRREFLPEELGVWYDRAIDKGTDSMVEELNKLIQENELLK